MDSHFVKLITSVEYLGHWNYQGLTILHFLSKQNWYRCFFRSTSICGLNVNKTCQLPYKCKEVITHIYKNTLGPRAEQCISLLSGVLSFSSLFFPVAIPLSFFVCRKCSSSVHSIHVLSDCEDLLLVVWFFTWNLTLAESISETLTVVRKSKLSLKSVLFRSPFLNVYCILQCFNS